MTLAEEYAKQQSVDSPISKGMTLAEEYLTQQTTPETTTDEILSTPPIMGNTIDKEWSPTVDIYGNVVSKKPDSAIEPSMLDPIAGVVGGAKGIIAEGVGVLGAEAGFETAKGIKFGYNALTGKKLEEEHPNVNAVLDVGMSLYGGYKAGKITQDKILSYALDKMDVTKLPTNIANIAKTANMSDVEVADILKNVEPDQWAKVLAQHGGDKTAGLLVGGITQDANTKGKYAEELTARVRAIKESLEGKSFTEYKEAVALEYNSMKSMVKELSINPNQTYDSTSIIATLNSMSKEIGNDTIVGRLKKTAQELSEKSKGSYTIEDMIELKEEINYELRKASPSDERKLGAFKKSINDFIKSNVDEKTYKLIDDATGSFSDMKQTQKAVDILSSNTKTRMTANKKGSMATDWDKTSAEFEKEFKFLLLKNPEKYKAIKSSLSLTKRFQNKFGSGDIELFGETKPSPIKDKVTGEASVSPQYAGQRLGTSRFMRWVAGNIPFSDTAKAIKMEKAIAKSISKSNSEEEFIKNMIKNENTPASVINRLNENLSKFQSNLQQREFDLQVQKNAEINQKKMEVLGGEKKSRVFGLDSIYGGKPTRPKQGKEVGGLERLGGTKTPTPEAPIVPSNPIQNLGQGTQGVGGLNNMPNVTTTPKPKKPMTTTGSDLGLGINYGGKPTNTGGINTAESKQTIKTFMDDIANPKVSVDNNKVSELFSVLKAEGTTMYGATVAKEKAWNKAMDIVNYVKNKKNVSTKEREQMIQAVKEYYDLIGSTI